jgi:4-amino-4-deoxy-L-arabinose transferase-like glycosyltransferase
VKTSSSHRLPWLVPLLIAVFYLVTHLYKLVLLPVFADESIYIRWSQLMIDNWKQYAFFPLNDGKTPLQMWLLVPLLQIGKDPLWTARLLSVLAGLAQIFVSGAIVKALGGRRMTVWLSMILTAILPMWYFHHRMALIDALLTLWLSLSIWGTIKLVTSAKMQRIRWAVATGLFFGLALLTKLPAILFIPAFPLFSFLTKPKNATELFKRWSFISLSVVLGLGMFVLLKIHPAFGQLFSRGGDFLHPWQYIFLHGGWMSTVHNIPSYLRYATQYLTLPVLVLIGFGLFAPDPKRRQQMHVLFWSGLAFAAPIVLMGKVVYPRYFMPISIFATVITALAIETIVINYVQKPGLLWKKSLAALATALLLSNIAGQSITFMAAAVTDPAALPFVRVDREQYLGEWSSGHGITQTVELIKQQSQHGTIAVATEGSFGTLPDGILMYLHRSDVHNIYVEGIGYPVKGIPEKFSTRAKDFQTVWLVVNSHRLEIPLNEKMLVAEYCRPDNAPCLQVWDITSLVKTGKP